MADNTGYETAKKRFDEAKKAWENRGNVSSAESQKLLREFYKARNDMVERTPMGALGAGFLRTAGETVTGIPDLLTEAVNWATRKGAEAVMPSNLSSLIAKETNPDNPSGVYQAPTLGGLFRKATGQSEGPKTPELSYLYNAPGIAAATYGVTSLARTGWKAFKNAQVTKKAEELLGDLNPTDRNIFQNWMVKGQGSSSPEVAALLEKVKTNPKYSELFTALENEAGKQALKNIKPTGGTQTAEEASQGLARAVQSKLEKVKTERSIAGNEAFDKAFKTAGDSAFVDTSATRATIARLRKEYPDNDNIQAYLTGLEKKLVPTFDVPARAGTQYTVREATPTRVIPGAPARTDTATQQIVGMDAAGMPITSSSPRAIPVQGSPATSIPGSPAVMGEILGSAGYTVTQSPVKLTVDRVQGFLHEFSKEAKGSDSVITGLSVTDAQRVHSALLGGLKDDLLSAVKTAATPNEKKAAAYLVQARSQYADASDAYNKLIAQGIPKWLQNKELNQINLEELTKAYQETNPAQRQVFRDWVSSSRAESLKALDKAVFDDFLSDTYKKLPDGTFGYDLGTIADKWQTLKQTNPNKAGQVADSLGTDVNEFSKRMKDAAVFTRKIKISAPAQEAQAIPGDIQRTAAALVGSTPAGYQGAKVAEISMDAVNELFKKRGLTEEQLMKVILTDSGKDFLKNAAISPQSAKTLEFLTAVDKMGAPFVFQGVSAGAGVPTGSGLPAQPAEVPEMPQMQLAPELGGGQESDTSSATAMPEMQLAPELQ